MNYEEFEARAKSAFDDCGEMKRVLWNVQTVVAAVPDMVRKNERLDRERAELKQDNAALKAELDDWKGNAEGFQPDEYMKLPLDADGVPIRIGDEVFRLVDGSMKLYVSAIEFTEKGCLIMAKTSPNLLASGYTGNTLRHKKPEPLDSWEKLEEDAKMVKACDYVHAPRDEYGITVCRDCRFQKSESCRQEMILDMIARAKKLAGVEEQEGE